MLKSQFGGPREKAKLIKEGMAVHIKAKLWTRCNLSFPVLAPSDYFGCLALRAALPKPISQK
jgi:hypothetical protein